MGEYLKIANSNLLFILVSIVMLMVAVQAVLFIRMAIKRSRELGIKQATMNKVVTNSATFSILPSLPIIITLLVMMPALGKYVPWLRLSVVGSAMYESLAADIAIKQFGYTGLGDMAITENIFGSIFVVMSIGVVTGPLLNTLFLKKYDMSMKKMSKSGGFMALITGAVFMGFMVVNIIPRALNFEAPVEIIVTFVAGVSALLLDYIGKKAKIRALTEFSFPLAMLVGMASAIVYNLI